MIIGQILFGIIVVLQVVVITTRFAQDTSLERYYEKLTDKQVKIANALSTLLTQTQELKVAIEEKGESNNVPDVSTSDVVRPSDDAGRPAEGAGVRRKVCHFSRPTIQFREDVRP